MSGTWRIQLLGELRAVSDGRAIARFRTRQTASLLAYLAFYRHRAHPREQLIEQFWPEGDERSGRHNLSNALSSLRRQFEPPGVAAGSVICADRATVQLNAATVATDVGEFQAALRAAARAGSEVEQAECLRRALDLYRGPLLPGFYDEWCAAERERLADAYIGALRHLIQHLRRMGDLERALSLARQAAAADPLREAVQRELIRLLLDADRPDGALQQYRDLERRLRAELGVSPGAATRALVAVVQARSATGELRSAAAGAAREASPAAAALPNAGQEGGGTARTAWDPVVGCAPRAASAPAAAVAAAILTFLATDLEAAASERERAGPAFSAALLSHNALLRWHADQYGGRELREVGGAFLLTFARASDAIICAVEAQRALQQHPWPEQVGPMRVRMALHAGEVEERDGSMQGPATDHATRLALTAHGGQILCSESVASLVDLDSHAGLALRRLGAYRVRDWRRPESLYQVEYPGMPRRDFPRPRAEAGHTPNLPARLTHFFGREEELAGLIARLLAEDTRLLTLTGPGGVGKTRLAVEAAARLVEAFRGAVWLVPLADIVVPTPEVSGRRLIEAVRDALHLPGQPAEPLQQVVDALARQPALLLLDNLEQLLPPAAACIAALLTQVPTLKCLTTSRQLLEIAGEREFAVAPLPVPTESRRLRAGPSGTRAGAAVNSELLSLTRCPSVQLFIDRAQAVRADFQVTRQNAADLGQLCRRLEGIPLAIELAASRCQSLTPAQILPQVRQGLDLLVSRRRDLPSRHRTLRAAIDWSYELLIPDLQHLFAQLSVFRGGGDLEAVTAVCGADGSGAPLVVLERLEQLRSASLVTLFEGAARPGHPPPVRFSMLEALRLYADERLSADARGLVGCRHAAYFLALAEAAAPEMHGEARPYWLERLDEEHDNFRAALDWAVRMADDAGARPADSALARPASREATHPPSGVRTPDPELPVRLAGALWRFWEARGYFRRGRFWLTVALARSGARTAARARALYGVGALAHAQDDSQSAVGSLEESAAIAREVGDRRQLAEVLSFLGYILRDAAGSRSRALMAEGLSLSRETGDPRLVATALYFLGRRAADCGDYAGAAPLLEESLAFARAGGDSHGAANAMKILAEVALGRGEIEMARRLLGECLPMFRSTGHSLGIAYTLVSLGGIAFAEARHNEARFFLEEALDLLRSIGHGANLRRLLDLLARVAAAQGDPEAARAFAEESARIARPAPRHVAPLAQGASSGAQEDVPDPVSMSDRDRTS